MMSRRFLARRALALSVLLLLLMTTPLAAAQQPALPADDKPCLTDDPYNLAQLAAVLSSDAPPTGPVTIGKDIVVQFIRSGKLVGGPEDRTEQETPPGGNPEPREFETPEMPLDGAALRVFNTRTQFEFRLSMSDTMLKDIHGCREGAGLTIGGGPWNPGQIEGQTFTFLPVLSMPGGNGAGSRPTWAPSVAALTPDGWSNNANSRVVRSPTTV